MYQSKSIYGFEQVVIQQDDVCFECCNKYDCPLVCALNASIVTLESNEISVTSCNTFIKGYNKNLFIRIWLALRYIFTAKLY